ncbi:TPA: acyltransferase family protein [Proteus mirabilis]
MSFFYDFNMYQLVFFVLFLITIAIIPLKPSPIIQNNNNILWIEGLRGIACTMVFFNHFAYYLPSIGIENPNIPYEIMPIYDNFGSIGVEIFFAITGFLFISRIKKINNPDNFAMKRIHRLVPGFLFYSLINFCLFSIFMSYDATYNDYAKAIIQLFSFGFLGGGIFFKDTWINSIGVVSWTLPYEWIFYLLLVSIAIFSNRKIYSSSVLFIISIYIIYKSDLNLNMFLFFFSGAIGWFVHRLTPRNIIERLISYLILIITLLICIYQKDDQYGFYRVILITIMFSGICYLKPKILSGSYIVFTGMISYSIYLGHQAIIYTLFKTFSIAGVNLTNISIYTYFILSIVVFLVTLYVSKITYIYVEIRFNKKTKSN